MSAVWKCPLCKQPRGQHRGDCEDIGLCSCGTAFDEHGFCPKCDLCQECGNALFDVNWNCSHCGTHKDTTT